MDALERANNRLRDQIRRVRLALIVTVGLGSIGAYVLISQTLMRAITPIDPRPILTVDGFLIANNKGETRATLLLDDATETPMWTLFDSEGNPWTRVAVDGSMHTPPKRPAATVDQLTPSPR